MPHSCEDADRPALTEIARALLAEASTREGEARHGRLRLVQNINTKLHRIGGKAVVSGSKAADVTAFDLIERAAENESLCAHTRNFLEMAMSRMNRFDEETSAANLIAATGAQIAAGVAQASIPSE